MQQYEDEVQGAPAATKSFEASEGLPMPSGLMSMAARHVSECSILTTDHCVHTVHTDDGFLLVLGVMSGEAEVRLWRSLVSLAGTEIAWPEAAPSRAVSTPHIQHYL